MKKVPKGNRVVLPDSEYGIEFLREDHPALMTNQVYPEDVRLFQVRKRLLEQAHELIKDAAWLNRDDPAEITIALLFQYQKILNRLYETPAEYEGQSVMYRVLRDPEVLGREFTKEVLINRSLSSHPDDVRLTKEEYEVMFQNLVAGAVEAKRRMMQQATMPTATATPPAPAPASPMTPSQGLGLIKMMQEEAGDSPMPYEGGRLRHKGG